jgi:hypothetical protein
MSAQTGKVPAVVGVDVRDRVSLKGPIDAASNVLAALLLLLIAGRFYESWRLNEALVDDVARFRAREWRRPVLGGEVLSGTFAERIATALEVPALPKDCSEAFQNFRDGRRVGPIPDHCLRAAEERMPRVESLLLATHAERGGALPGDWREPAVGVRENWLRFNDVIEITMLAATKWFADGRDAEALGLCRDLLAFGRDVALTGGNNTEITQMSTLYGVSRFCSAAFTRTDARTRRELLSAMLRLRAVRPRLADAVELASLKRRLSFFSELFTDAQRARLLEPPPPFGGIPGANHSELPFRWAALPRLMHFEKKRVAAAASPATYAIDVTRLEAELADTWTPFVADATLEAGRRARGEAESFAICDAKADLFVALLEISLDPTRLWDARAAGEPVVLRFHDDGRVALGVTERRVTPLFLAAPLIPELAGPSEPGALLRRAE